MANNSITVGTVKKINLTDNDPNDVYSIQCYIQGNVNNQIKAYPYDMSVRRIPLIGEAVILIQGQGSSASPSMRQQNSTYYYLNPISLQKNPHNNALPGSNTYKGSSNTAVNYIASSAGIPGISGDSTPNLGDGFVERDDVASLQPFIGDVLVEGRFGHSIRFGFTPNPSKTSLKPSWSSNNGGDPITIISNGRGQAGQYNKFTIEDVNEDLSSIWLSSSQKIKLTPSQNKIGIGVKAQAQFTNPSIVLNSDRVLINARNERVIISGKQDIVNSTPTWAMEMDKFFDLIEDLVSELADLTSARASYTTGVGPTGPATNAAKVQTILTELKKMKQ